MKNLSIALAVLAVAAAGYYSFMYFGGDEGAVLARDHKNATYIIGGRSVTLTDGWSETDSGADSSSKIVTRYFGNEVWYDLDGDGREDVVFLLTQETGGSGTFFYVVAALDTADGFIGSQGLLLGDRIAPQTTEVSRNPDHKNVIVVNYADRKPGEPMTTRPSQGKSIWLKLNPETMQFGEVVQNFEGEADPSRMTLGMKTWIWIKALYNDGKEITPKQSGKFTLTLSDGGKFSATTDCNRMGGSYSAEGGKISFGPIASTEMYCEGSQESDFAKLLEGAQFYRFTSRGEMVIDFKYDSGSATFR